MKFQVTFPSGSTVDVTLPDLESGETSEVELDGRTVAVTLESLHEDRIVLRLSGQRFVLGVEQIDGEPRGEGRTVRLLHRNRPCRVTATGEFDRLRSTAATGHGASGPVTLYSALPGVIRQVFLEPGSPVEADTPVLTLEAMKMENEVRAGLSGRVDAIHVTPGQVVAAREALARIVPESS